MTTGKIRSKQVINALYDFLLNKRKAHVKNPKLVGIIHKNLDSKSRKRDGFCKPNANILLTISWITVLPEIKKSKIKQVITKYTIPTTTYTPLLNFETTSTSCACSIYK